MGERRGTVIAGCCRVRGPATRAGGGEYDDLETSKKSRGEKKATDTFCTGHSPRRRRYIQSDYFDHRTLVRVEAFFLVFSRCAFGTLILGQEESARLIVRVPRKLRSRSPGRESETPDTDSQKKKNPCKIQCEKCIDREC